MDRRDLLKGAGGALAAAALTPAAATAKETDSCGRVADPAAFVLVPGAWCGGWVWDDVAPVLRAAGHRVFTPSMTGLADRSHLLSKDISLATFVTDVVNLIKWEELSGIVLAGHSHGGVVISGVAEAVPEGTIHSIVYLDALFREMPTASPSGGGGPGAPEPTVVNGVRCSSPPSAELIFHLTGDAAARADRLLTPMPLATLPTHNVSMRAVERTPVKTYVRATRSDFPLITDATKRDLVAEPSWRYREIDSGHMMMIEKPDETARIFGEAI